LKVPYLEILARQFKLLIAKVLLGNLLLQKSILPLQVIVLFIEILNHAAHFPSGTAYKGLTGYAVCDFAWEIEGSTAGAALVFGCAFHLLELEI
jgi:hypothetical protein